MLRNYMKVCIRNLKKHKNYSIINIIGLSIGIASVILILLWVVDELSYDRFHKDADNIYLVLRGSENEMSAITSLVLAPKLKEEIPEIENSTYFAMIPKSISFYIQYGDKGFNESVAMAATNFFEMFSFRFKKGNQLNALSEPNSIVITDEIAKKYFGEEDPFGKTLSINSFGEKRVMKVSGILEDIPHNSHIQSQIYISDDLYKSVITKVVGANFDYWNSQFWQTYIKVNPKSDINTISSRIKECEIKHHPMSKTLSLVYSQIALPRIHLYGNGIQFFKTATGDVKYIRIFLLIAVIILIIASINYMNLSTALALKRTKEVGIRKTFGANKKSLIVQFFGEGIILSFIALCFAILLIEILLPEFNLISGKKMVIRLYDPIFISLSLLATIITGVFSGFYPAIFLSSYKPIEIFKGKIKFGSGAVFTRKSLVIFQFILSSVVIVCTLVIFNQLSYIKNKNLGLDKENIICVRLSSEANNKFDELKNSICRNHEILDISRSESISSNELGVTSGVIWSGRQNDNEKFWELSADYNMISTYKIELKEGRYFSEEFPTDKTNAYVINESAAKALNMRSAIGNEINVNGRKGNIIGIVKDFNFSSLRNSIEPLIISIPLTEKQELFYTTLAVRVKPGTLLKNVSYIKNIWREKIPNIPLDYYFLDESINLQYGAEERMSVIFNYFSFLSIVIACLGLLGLSSFSAEKRTKEIGIRKILGATSSDISAILSKEYVFSIFIANIIAWPIAYYFMQTWLQEFAYRIELTWWMFVFSLIIALFIAFLSIGFQIIKTALLNPAKTLRYE